MLPDADVIGFAFGIRYADMLGHRGLSHSFFFAAIVGLVVAALYGERSRRRAWLAVYFAAVTASHALLDGLTDGGLGVALFAPFSNERYFLPWRPIEVSPIGPGFFSAARPERAHERVALGLDPIGVLVAMTWLGAESEIRRRYEK